MARKIGPIGPVQSDIPVSKRSGAGGRANYAKHRAKDKAHIQEEYEALLRDGPVSDKARTTYVADTEEKYDYKIDKKAIIRYLTEVDDRLLSDQNKALDSVL